MPQDPESLFAAKLSNCSCRARSLLACSSFCPFSSFRRAISFSSSKDLKKNSNFSTQLQWVSRTHAASVFDTCTIARSLLFMYSYHQREAHMMLSLKSPYSSYSMSTEVRFVVELNNMRKTYSYARM